MNNLPETISQTINVLTEKFGSTGTHLWEILVYGEQVECIGGFVFGTILVVLGIVFGRKDDDTVPYGLVSGLALVFGITFVLCSFVGAFMPEYAVLVDLIGK